MCRKYESDTATDLATLLLGSHRNLSRERRIARVMRALGRAGAATSAAHRASIAGLGRSRVRAVEASATIPGGHGCPASGCEDRRLVFVVVFHSMFGVRAVELSAAERMRAAGCHVVVPDLFAGEAVPGGIEAGFALMEHVGWPTIVDRARRALANVPEEAVLGGFSMGVGVIGELWPERLGAAAVFCPHAPRSVPPGGHAGAVACRGG